MTGGYAVIAGELNKRFAPQPPIDRRQVYQWDQRQTRNAAGAPPPAPVQVKTGVPRSTPTRLFEAAEWVTWFEAGVPGPRRAGWRRWVRIDQPVNDPAPYRVTRKTSTSTTPPGNRSQAGTVDRIAAPDIG